MRGFLGYALGVASVCWLIPWPSLWPATIVAIVVAGVVVPVEPSASRGTTHEREGR